MKTLAIALALLFTVVGCTRVSNAQQKQPRYGVRFATYNHSEYYEVDSVRFNGCWVVLTDPDTGNLVTMSGPIVIKDKGQ